MSMITKTIRNLTVNQMLNCDSTKKSFWSREFMINSNELFLIKKPETVIISLFESCISVEVKYDDTLEKLESLFSAAISKKISEL